MRFKVSVRCRRIGGAAFVGIGISGVRNGESEIQSQADEAVEVEACFFSDRRPHAFHEYQAASTARWHSAVVPCYSPLKGWKDPETGGIQFRAEGAVESMEVACGSCLGCRLDRSRMWAVRCVHEAGLPEHVHGNSFVTLTYRDKGECTNEQLAGGFHIPDDWSLRKDHFQKFMKRLRKRFSQRIRFFHCGEYGNRCPHGLDLRLVQCPLCTVGRPHYHALLFNCSFDDLEPYKQERGEVRYTSEVLSDVWKYGFVDVGQVNFESAAYVARYALKKVNGVQADSHYFRLDHDTGEMWFIEPEYCTMSRRPGIGKGWFQLFADDCFPSDDCPVPGSGVFKKVPRYYETLFGIADPLGLEEVKAMRQEFRREHAHEYTPERLMSKYKVKKAQVGLLKRSV